MTPAREASQASAPRMAARRLRRMEAGRERKKARNARPQAMGCRMRARVSVEVLLNVALDQALLAWGLRKPRMWSSGE
jgi:hypothetical protein